MVHSARGSYADARPSSGIAYEVSSSSAAVQRAEAHPPLWKTGSGEFLRRIGTTLKKKASSLLWRMAPKQTTFDFFIKLGRVTIRAAWDGRTLEDLETIVLKAFGASQYTSALSDRDPYFLILRPFQGIQDLKVTAGFAPLLGTEPRVPDLLDAWLLITDEKQLEAGCLISVGDPAWRSVLLLGLAEARGLDVLRPPHVGPVGKLLAAAGHTLSTIRHSIHESRRHGEGRTLLSPRPAGEEGEAGPGPGTSKAGAPLSSFGSPFGSPPAPGGRGSSQKASGPSDSWSSLGPDTPGGDRSSRPGGYSRATLGTVHEREDGLQTTRQSAPGARPAAVPNPGGAFRARPPPLVIGGGSADGSASGAATAPGRRDESGLDSDLPSRGGAWEPRGPFSFVNARRSTDDRSRDVSTPGFGRCRGLFSLFGWTETGRSTLSRTTGINSQIGADVDLSLSHYLYRELMHWRQKLNLFLFWPQYKSWSWAYMCFVQLVICIAVTNTLAMTGAESHGTTDRWPSFLGVETFCMAVFILDFTLRLLAFYSLTQFFFHPATWVDIMSMVPFFVDRALKNTGHESIPALYILQVIRIVRLLKIFRFSQGLMAVFLATVQEVSLSLAMLVLYTLIGVVVYGSIFWFIERGKYNKTLGAWERPQFYDCPFPCPDAKYMDEYGPFYAFFINCSPGLNTTVTLPRPAGPFKRECHELYTQSSFNSIPASMYYALITLTTVGYGDLVPYSGPGKLFGGLAMLCGLLVVALPVSVVAGRFDSILKKHEAIYGRMTRLETLGLRVDYHSVHDKERTIDLVWSYRRNLLNTLRLLKPDDFEPGSSDDEDQPLIQMQKRVVYRVSRLTPT